MYIGGNVRKTVTNDCDIRGDGRSKYPNREQVRAFYVSDIPILCAAYRSRKGAMKIVNVNELLIQDDSRDVTRINQFMTN